ncbi:MAG TPA: chemotaxis protein CheB [Verrucomicrobiae bacterium]|nr:chemotaxis protein CheB [Verrucomicrobiae bacterium]
MHGTQKSRFPTAAISPDTASTTAETRLQKSADGEVFPIVGIGASAGGLEAVTQLFQHLPATPGMAFVLVQHLDPTHKSELSSLLSRATAMRVTEAKHNLRLEPNRVYVISPNKMIDVAGRQLKISPRRDTKDLHMPIDHFLESLAEEEGGRSIGVVLSGNGSDGTRGLRAVKAVGGITFAQDEKSAKYPYMPASAIHAGCVDFVLPPIRIAQELVSIASHPYVATGRVEEAEPPVAGTQKLYEEIFSMLRRGQGVDFSQYKRATLVRRVQRRMVLHKIGPLKEYVAYLRAHSAEVQALFNDILIHVTGFFRDRHVFQMLKRRVFARLLKNRSDETPIRIWVPGCSTGEEAYSLAMALMEFLGRKKSHVPIQIFGTDINLPALDRARAGHYPASISRDVSAERLRRFFVKADGGYRITKAIREMCIFARQNLVTDPPFSNLDLITCRNVLIYLSPALQRKVFPVFHYGLKPNGILVLGASETIGSFADLFSLVDKKARAYARKSVHSRPAVSFVRSVAGAKADLPQPAAPATTGQQIDPGLAEIRKHADRYLLAHFCPAGVVINRRFEVLQFCGRTGPYLEHAQGEASLNLLKMVREGLILDLRSAVAKAVKQNVPVRLSDLHVKMDGGFHSINLEVVPFHVPLAEEKYYLVIFGRAGKPAESESAKAGAGKQGRGARQGDGRELARLREELAATHESLQSIIEEQEATNEELRSANEEIMSSNEEMQSTNEELETAKEELQSTNEELTTLNDELHSRNNELEQVNNDLHNIMTSINIPIVMVGQDLRIRRFSAVAERLLNLIPSDVGRPITDIKMGIELPDVHKLIGGVIDSLQTKELELPDKQGHLWSARIRPYKSRENKIDGAVIAMVDLEPTRSAAAPPAQPQ